MGELASLKYSNIAVCPSAGIGHLVPFLRLASMLSSSKCTVTLVNIEPTLTSAETTQISSFLANHPHIHSLQVHLPCVEAPPSNASTKNASTTTKPTDGPDPFFLRYAVVSRSAHLIAEKISTLSPLPCAVISDIMLASGFNDALGKLGIANYLLVTTSARFFSLTTYLPDFAKNGVTTTKLEMNSDIDEEMEIPPGISPIPKSSIPPPFFMPNHVFTKMLVSNSSSLPKAKGIILNSFDSFEHETISALKSRKILSDLPPIYTIGPLKPLKDQKVGYYPAWLNDQPCKSVLFVSFGSRTAMKEDQIRELGDALKSSEVRFLWVIKTTKVDKDVVKEAANELLGEEFLELTKERGLVVEEWVDQEAILDHPAVGGFMTHCGWNSIMEAGERGMPVLAWPHHGDQKVNAAVVQKAGLGVWEKGWGWVGERLVKSEEIAKKIKEVMTSEELRISAMKVGEEAAKAWKTDYNAECGSSSLMLKRMVDDIFESEK